MREKHLLGPFKGFFMNIETFFYLYIVPSVTRDNVEIKKVEISIKNPEKDPNKCFHKKKKISSQTLQNSRDVLVGSFMHSRPTYLNNLYCM